MSEAHPPAKKKQKKRKRPDPRLPRGFRDLPPGDLVLRREMIRRVCEVYERYGFTPLETPAVEYVETLGKFLPEADQPDGGIFAWRYDDGEWVALRYDLTAPLSRYVAKNFQELGMPFRRYQTGPVWRLEKPEPGRYREFVQLDIDIVGAGSVLADAEVIDVLAHAMEALEIPRGSYLVCVNHRRVLNGLLERAAVPPEKTLPVLRALDKLDRLGLDGVRALLGPGRRDQGSAAGEGDFTPGADLAPEQIETLLAFLAAPAEGRRGYLEAVRPLVEGTPDGDAGLAELAELDAILDERGLGTDRVVFNPTVVRGLGYYTGAVVEVVLTFEVEEGAERRRFGSVAGGGRYDDLIARFTGQKVPATGASIGVDRLLAALKALGKVETDTAGKVPVLVTTMDRSLRREYQAWADELRAAGIATELYCGSGNVGKQFKYADRRGFTVAVVAGGDEMSRGEVSLKDLRLGKELSRSEELAADRKQWLEQLPGQFSVPRERLVDGVREVLARYGR
ncbi:MAG: histidine--tRNA ligase [Planctomycetota bacterium]|nr:MAG: histidine--tRNA ligase [Planctomycetota bacterium]